MNPMQSPNTGVGGKDHGSSKFSDHIIQTAKDYGMDPQIVQDIFDDTTETRFYQKLEEYIEYRRKHESGE